MNYKNYTLSILLIACMTGCSSYKPFYANREKDWKTTALPQVPVKYSVYLIGDAGEPLANSGDVLNMLQEHLSKSDSNHLTIFLGDNIYHNGLPAEDNVSRKSAEEKIDAQLNPLMNDKGRVLFVPGNHDWNDGKDNGRAYVMREEQYIENKLNKGNVFLPDNGCPGPVEVQLTDDLVLVPLNTQWWLQKNKNTDNSDDCETKNELDWVNQVRDVLDNNQRKNILVVGHHALQSVGNHAGYFPLKEHIFPLTAWQPGLYLPLPIIGSIYPLYRAGIGAKQDFASPAFTRLRDNLMHTFEGYENLIYASGHEHNLQYFQKDNQHFIVSGSGSKTTWVAHNNNASFTDAEKGFVKLNYLQNGEVWMQIFVADKNKKEGVIVFQKKLKDSNYGKYADNTAANSTANYADSSILIAANKDFKVGKFKQFLLGKHYRSAWTTPVKVPFLDLEKDHGGLEIIKKGGGMQTKSLRLIDKQGEEFALRSVAKYPDKLLPKEMLNTFAADVVRDQASTTNPYGAYVVDDLAEAAGILHTVPTMVYIPDDPKLGDYRKDFANTLALYEQRPEGDLSQVGNFGNTKEALSSPKMFNKLRKDNANAVDEYSLAKSRLFDMWINDWDRHEDQWRWATIKCDKKNKDYCEKIKAGDEYFVPIPRDRDQAFAKFDGLFPSLAGRKWTGRKFQNFNEDIRDVPGLNFNGRYLDHTLLTQLSLDEWRQIANDLMKTLTDEKIEKAIKHLPDTIYKLDGKEIIGKLKSRRDKINSFAARYYNFLAEQVNVTGSDKKEIFEVKRLNDDATSVKVYDEKKGEKSRLIYDRDFMTNETKEIRLYGQGGDDVFNISGNVDKGILVRVIGGEGNDVITDDSHVNGWCKKTKVYDDANKNSLKLSSEAKDLTSNEKDINEYTRFSYEYDLLAPATFFGSSKDDGFFIGGGVLMRHSGFRKKPYASLQRIVANVSTSGGSFNFKYNGDFVNVFGKWGLNVDVSVLAPKSITNFYGLGNDTKLASSASLSYYRLRYDQLNVTPLLKRTFGKYHSFKFGPVYEYIKIEKTPDRFISSSEGQLYINDFSARNFGGMKFEYEFKNVNDPVMPTRGISWSVSSKTVESFSNSSEMPTNLESQLSFYIPLPNSSTFALRYGGATLIDDFEFFHANTLGGVNRERGSGNLRGYLRGRFAGRSIMYLNADLRIKLFNFTTYLFPAKFGILGFFDEGKVWTDDIASTTWHQGYGGGIWINPMQRAIINATYAISKEEKLFTLGLGFAF